MSNKEIYLSLFNHDNSQRLLLIYRKDEVIESIASSLPGVLWLADQQLWHVRNDQAMINHLKNKFYGIATLNLSEVETKTIEEIKTTAELKVGLKEKRIINQNLHDFKLYLKHKRYSESTIKTYRNVVIKFLNYTGLPVEMITNSHLISFNNFLFQKGYSNSFQNQVASGLKLFFLRIHNVEFDIEKIERPRTEHRLPNVLSKDEIKRLLRAPGNLKHRTILSIIYACGLRRSELINLKPVDIDSSRGVIIIRQSKGRKDRVVPLPDRILESLRIYFRAYKPKTWLFEGSQSNSQYSPTSLAKILQRAVKKAGIKKPVTLHWLRHSYATHLLEQGTDLRFIQELLGHQSSKTTEIYTHVSTKNIMQVKSPFEDMDL